MKIFEFYFNPKAKKDRFFDIFSFESNNGAEKTKGNLYIVGELAHALPFQASFLRTVAEVIRNEYYASAETQQAALRSSLQKANKFLEARVREGNLDWLGNLHLAALVLIPADDKKTLLYFTKAGTAEVLLLHQQDVLNIWKSVDRAKTQADPAKVFGNVVAGTLVPGDKIVVLTREVFDSFVKEGLLPSLRIVQEEKELRKLFSSKERALSKLSGIFFSVFVEKNGNGTRQPFWKKKLPSFAFPVFRFSPLRIPRVRLPWRFSLRFPVLRGAPEIKKKSMILGAFVLLVSFGFLVFQQERRQEIAQAQATLITAQERMKEAERALGAADAQAADRLLQASWAELTLSLQKGTVLEETFRVLEQQTKEKLFALHKMQDIAQPKVAYVIDRKKTSLIPQNMVAKGTVLYLFNPFSSQLLRVRTEQKTQEVVETSKNLRYGAVFAGSPLFFADPHSVITENAEGVPEEFVVRVPQEKFSFDGMQVFGDSMYFFDAKTGEIVKYQNPLSGNAAGSFWLSPFTTQKAIGTRSMAVDGSIWILTKKNKIQRYYAGRYQETLQVSLFPALENASSLKIFPGLPYVYLLDPSQSRVVVLSKTGEVVKQYRSDAFDKLLDFTVSSDGRTIFLLNGFTVFQLAHELL